SLSISAHGDGSTLPRAAPGRRRRGRGLGRLALAPPRYCRDRAHFGVPGAAAPRLPGRRARGEPGGQGHPRPAGLDAPRGRPEGVSCLFCEIVAGRIAARVAYQDEDVIAFHDIDPQGPVHILVVPKRHVTSLLELGPEDDVMMGSLVRRARDLAQETGLAERG